MRDPRRTRFHRAVRHRSIPQGAPPARLRRDRAHAPVRVEDRRIREEPCEDVTIASSGRASAVILFLSNRSRVRPWSTPSPAHSDNTPGGGSGMRLPLLRIALVLVVPGLSCPLASADDFAPLAATT